ncbi:hypothetical protein [Streptomyces sp. NPDC059783]
MAAETVARLRLDAGLHPDDTVPAGRAAPDGGSGREGGEGSAGGSRA